jgi:ribosomal protein S18 acetylase RimI-like enzyme
MKNLQLRPATINDSEFAYQTKKAAFREYAEHVWGWDEDEQRKLHQRRFAVHDFRVIQVAGTDVGIMAMERKPDCINLHQLFILPEYQERGIGEAVMKLLINESAGAKLPIRLQVLKVNNRALTFYQRLGFKRTGESETHILMERVSDRAQLY